MSGAMIAALFFTVALLVTTGYFMLGSIPLLVLKHNTPLDARFVRSFFNVYYRAAVLTAGATSICYAFAGRPALATGAAALALLAMFLRIEHHPQDGCARSPNPVRLAGCYFRLSPDPHRRYRDQRLATRGDRMESYRRAPVVRGGCTPRKIRQRCTVRAHSPIPSMAEEKMMKTILRALAVASAFLALPAFAQPAAEVTLTRLDCGNGFNDQRRFSDTFAYTEPRIPFTFSCYVIKHGDDYMVWDTGYLPGSNPNAPTISLAAQLAQIRITPDQVKFVGISHFHADHTGQLGTVPSATLLIGEREWAALTAPKPMAGANVAGFTHWISGGGKVQPQAGDLDVFGDGTVMILRTPGHTPGHQSLLVRLKEKGPVILVGDAAHFHENYQNNGVPGFNYDRAETLASLERLKQIEKNLKATVIIQHDPRDVGKLPVFPMAAR